MKKSKILVAGGTGLVGANLVQYLVETGADVRASHCTHEPPLYKNLFSKFNFTDLNQCLEATKDCDEVYICAAQTFGVQSSKDNPTSMLLPNLQINSNLLEASRANGIKKVQFISSSIVYQEASFPIREDQLDLNINPFSLYLGTGWTKRYVEQLCHFYNTRFDMDVTVIRPTNIYGPYDKFEEGLSHVIPALIKRAVAKEDPFVVWGDGTSVKDFVFVEDFVRDMVDVMKLGKSCFPLNIAGGEPLTIRDAVDAILSVSGHTIKPVYDATKPTALKYRMLDTTKFESLLGKRKRTPFKDGIKKTIDWYKTTIDQN